MPALAFGLNTAKPQARSGKAKLPQKRKAVFEEEADDDGNEDGNDQDGDDTFSKLLNPNKSTHKTQSPLNGGKGDRFDVPSFKKSPKLTASSTPAARSSGADPVSKYTNLSALRSAKLQDQAASELDPSVYDYDAVYETFQSKPAKSSSSSAADGGAGPKYMTSLLQSSEVRKRDQLRAREKMLQKERENEGDEFADKEKFVTGAYKKQQEEMRQLEEEEKKREKEEDERRRKGGGMTAFNKALLAKEEERARQIEEAARMVKAQQDRGEYVANDRGNMGQEEEESTAQQARRLNESGAQIVTNDEGEVVDKRQLLSAGLNLAAKKKTSTEDETNRAKKRDEEEQRRRESSRSEQSHDRRMDQRERQTRMIERQIEEMAKKQQQEAAAEMKELDEKNKSRVSEAAKMGAKERYLQRKKEREEAAATERAKAAE